MSEILTDGEIAALWVRDDLRTHDIAMLLKSHGYAANVRIRELEKEIEFRTAEHARIYNECNREMQGLTKEIAVLTRAIKIAIEQGNDSAGGEFPCAYHEDARPCPKAVETAPDSGVMTCPHSENDEPEFYECWINYTLAQARAEIEGEGKDGSETGKTK